MKKFFINPEAGILRAGWRILAFAIIMLGINGTLMFTVRSIRGSLKATGSLWFLLLGISATLAVYITSKYLSKKPLSSLGLRKKFAVTDLIMGILISTAIMAMMFFLLWALGWIRYDGLSFWKDKDHTISTFTSASMIAMLAMIFQFTIVAWWEELAFRGIVLQYVSEGLSIKWGVFISTVAFGLIHAGNPNSTLLSTILIMLITLKLVYAYLKTGQLWMPIGLHLGWNFFQASIFGFASSGHLSPSLIAQTPAGPDWLSGGSFGAENSIIILPLTLASFLVIHLWVKYSRKKNDLGIAEFLVTEGDFQNGYSEDQVSS